MLLVDERIEAYAYRATRAEPSPLTQLEAETRASMECPQMLTGRVEGRLLKLLVEIHRPRLVVEIGTFTGYSALSMAEGLGPDGRLITCEIDPDAQALAQRAFDRSPLGRRIELRMGPALETIRSLDEPIDFAFIDADKESYPAYYEEILRRSRPGALILLDNMFQDGRVLDPRDPSALAIDGLNSRIVSDPRVENVLLTVRDGVQLVRKNA